MRRSGVIRGSISSSIVVAAVLRYTVFGRHVFAVGSNESTARLCGINIIAQLNAACDGDLEVDEHHTVEDTALALGEALRLQRGPAHQGTVNVGLAEQFGGVTRFDASPILNPDRSSYLGIVSRFDQAAKIGMDLLRLLRRGNFTRADCPNRLISDDRSPARIGADSLEGTCNLCRYHLLLHPFVSFFDRLADGRDLGGREGHLVERVVDDQVHLAVL